MAMRSTTFLEELDDRQREAVMFTDGPLMVLAGAGSGKTRVLTYRIAYLISKGVDPFNILALTFTNKAAREMRNRIERLVGPEARNLWMGTFHSVFAKILRSEAEKIGYQRNFTIYDSDDAKNLVKTIVKEMKLDEKLYKPSLIYNRISSCKNNLITAEDYVKMDDMLASDDANGRKKTAEIFLEYSKRCFKASAMDFDDLLLNTHKLLKKHTDVLNKYQHLFKYVLVDEYQDTNQCQYMIIKKLVAVSRNICVVGDDAQSIYSFRGANIGNILNFSKDYPEQKVIKLEQNYRSSKIIVAASGDIITHNKEKLEKNIWTSNPDGEKIKVLKAMTDTEEGKQVAGEIFRLIHSEQYSPNHISVLYRTNAQSRVFEESLRKNNIPYKIYGGTSFYQRKEIKDLIAYLRVCVNPKDEEALKRIINYPARGIGNTTLDKLMYIANEYQVSLWDALSKADHFEILKSAHQKLRDFFLMFENFRTSAVEKDAFTTAEFVAKQSGLLRNLYEDKTPEGISRYENIMELLNGIKEFSEDDTSESEKDLSAFLVNVSLLTDADEKENDDIPKIKLMTIHASKGLEFPAVFVVGMEENLFPSHMSLQSRASLEEERRLFYVASTRAEKKLYLSYAGSRFRHGNLMYCDPSRFIHEINNRYLDLTLTSQGKSLPDRNAVFGTTERVTRPGQFNINPVYKRKILENKYAPPDDGAYDDLSELREGHEVYHQRFGNGKVVEVSGKGSDSKAVVNFTTSGSKTLILRYAKMKILNN